MAYLRTNEYIKNYVYSSMITSRQLGIYLSAPAVSVQ
jgi:hypothetical protein